MNCKMFVVSGRKRKIGRVIQFHFIIFVCVRERERMEKLMVIAYN